jgi:hypothetical protein
LRNISDNEKLHLILSLDAVINQYKYSSLPELNAVLKQYNVMADPFRPEFISQ